MQCVNLPQAPLFGSVAEVGQRLAEVGYLASTAVATTVFLADRLGKPLLVEGPAGVGKTELAKAVAAATDVGSGAPAVLRGHRRGPRALRVEPRQAAAADHRGPGSRDVGRDPRRRLQRGVPAPASPADRDPPHRAHGAARRRDRQGRRRGRGPAAGGALATSRSRCPRWARSRRRGARSRCSPPTPRASCPRRSSGAACSCTSTSPTPTWSGASCSRGCRSWPSSWSTRWCARCACCAALELRKAPSVAETIDWGRTLLALGLDTLDDDAVRATLGVVLKHQSDAVQAAAELRLDD